MSKFSPTLLTLLIFSRLSFAQNFQEEILPPVVVTATRTEVSANELTTSLTTITAEEIRRQQAETVLDLLRTVPGIDVVQSGSRGTRTDVFIRGAEEDQVLVLIDGVEVNSATLGSFDFAHLTNESIERIEILRGAGGTLYGSQAIGGVIHIITKSGRGSPELLISVEGGNAATHRQALSLRGRTRRLGYFFSASRLETAGVHPFNDDYRNLAADARLDFHVTESALLRGIFHFRKTDVGLFNNNAFRTRAGDPNARENVTNYLFKFDWEHKALPQFDYRLSVSQFKEHDKFSDDIDLFDTGKRANRFRPRILTGDVQTNYRWHEWGTTTFGIEFKRREAITDTIRESPKSMAYYMQQQLEFFKRFFVVTGVRLDHHETFGIEWSPAVSAAYLISKAGPRLKVGYAEGIKAPSLSELFFPDLGNPDLRPEVSWEVNAGLEQTLGKMSLGATYFHRKVKDLILFAPPTFRATNVGEVVVDGIELFADINFTAAFALKTHYTFLDNQTSASRLVRRPKHRGTVLLNYQEDGFHMNLKANIVGRRDDLAAMGGAPITAPEHFTLDLAFSYRLPWKMAGVKDLSLYGKIENLFNRRYEEADGFPARPLNFLLGIRTALGKEK